MSQSNTGLRHSLGLKLVLSVLVPCAVTCAIGFFVRSSARAAASSAKDWVAKVATLENELTDLEQQVRALLEAASAPMPTSSEPTTTHRSNTPDMSEALLAQLHARISALESLQKDFLERTPDAWHWQWTNPATGTSAADIQSLTRELIERRDNEDEFPHIDWMRKLSDAFSIEAVARLRALVMDAGAPREARLEAIRALRAIGNRAGIGPELLDDSLCRAAIDLAAQTKEEQAREAVYSELQGRTHPALREHLLRASRNDPSPLVRDKIAACLGYFLPDPGVEDALRWMLANDSDSAVRKEADESLKKGGIR